MSFNFLLPFQFSFRMDKQREGEGERERERESSSLLFHWRAEQCLGYSHKSLVSNGFISISRNRQQLSSAAKTFHRQLIIELSEVAYYLY